MNGRSFEAVFAEITAGWEPEKTPVIMAGMVGSNTGWVTVPYLPCPIPLSDIGQQLTAVGQNIWIVPGLCVTQDNNHNVMRGEETQLLGAQQLAPSSLYVMPGTHCKWVRVDGEYVRDFRTAMTGELHYLLIEHSLISAGLPAQVESSQAFRAGLERGSDSPDVLAQLFEVRASHVLGKLDRTQVSEFLSGLLIGAEVASMTRDDSGKQAITLVASRSLAERYQQAFALLGRTVQTVSGDIAFQAGIRSIAHAVEK
jgi:2-dehydro-3-deoxygalactonokinase